MIITRRIKTAQIGRALFDQHRLFLLAQNIAGNFAKSLNRLLSNVIEVRTKNLLDPLPNRRVECGDVIIGKPRIGRCGIGAQRRAETPPPARRSLVKCFVCKLLHLACTRLRGRPIPTAMRRLTSIRQAFTRIHLGARPSAFSYPRALQRGVFRACSDQPNAF